MNNPFHGTLAMARLEFEQALFSARSIIFVALFLLLMGAAGAFGISTLFLNPSTTAGGIAATTAFLLVAMVLIVLLFGPAVAVFSSSDAIVAERQARTLDTLLARPLTRRGLALGKFLGRGLHLALLAMLGVLLGSAFFASRVTLDFGKVLAFAALAALLFLIYAALSFVLSSLSKSPATATALGAGVWLTFYVLWGFVVEGLRGVGLAHLAPWLNPNTLFLGAVSDAFPEPGNLAGLAGNMTPEAALLGLLAYLVIAVALAVEVFHRQDETGT
jgi:ABC-type transport system involved in multi-copper enzyme maturation permease subunit